MTDTEIRRHELDVNLNPRPDVEGERRQSSITAQRFTVLLATSFTSPDKPIKTTQMGWLVAGIVYSVGYAGIGFALRDDLTALSWFRAAALALPPLTAAVVIVRKRHTWTGCQWLFWSTIALGLAMSAIGLTGWAAEELMFGQQSWLAWPAVFALFGNVAPLFALLAQPHRGPREPLAATTSVDIAGLAVVTGFLYSFFVTGIDPATASSSLVVVSEIQAAVVALALIAAVFAAGPANGVTRIGASLSARLSAS